MVDTYLKIFSRSDFRVSFSKGWSWYPVLGLPVILISWNVLYPGVFYFLPAPKLSQITFVCVASLETMRRKKPKSKEPAVSRKGKGGAWKALAAHTDVLVAIRTFCKGQHQANLFSNLDKAKLGKRGKRT